MSVAPVCPGIMSPLAAFLVGLTWLQPVIHLIPSSSPSLLTFATPAPSGTGSEPRSAPLLCPLQDDMHRVIDRQLMDTHLKERSRPAAALSRAHGAGRGDEPSTAEGKRLFSFFRKI